MAVSDSVDPVEWFAEQIGACGRMPRERHDLAGVSGTGDGSPRGDGVLPLPRSAPGHGLRSTPIKPCCSLSMPALNHRASVPPVAAVPGTSAHRPGMDSGVPVDPSVT